MFIMTPTTSKATRTRILFDATRRHPAPPTFGRGILPYVASDGRKPYTQADLEWAAQVLNAEATDFEVEPDWDAMAHESYAQDALDLGLIPPDTAESIARSSLVGLHEEMVDAYADEAERLSGVRPSHEAADRALTLAWARLR